MMRTLLLVSICVLCAGCIERDRYFTITAGYLLTSASHNGLSVRAGGIVPAGHDLASTSLAYLRFVGFDETPRDVVICHTGDRVNWFTTAPYPGKGLISDWVAQERGITQTHQNGRIDMDAVMVESGVRWFGETLPKDVGSVVQSVLGGPKGAISKPEDSFGQISGITHSHAYANKSEWVDLMLDACGSLSDLA